MGVVYSIMRNVSIVYFFFTMPKFDVINFVYVQSCFDLLCLHFIHFVFSSSIEKDKMNWQKIENR